MPYSKKYNCLFIHIPKTAGTSIEKALEIFGDWEKEDKAKLFGQIKSKELIDNKKIISNFLQHIRILDAYEVNPSLKSHFSFSFTRNPWDKMVSVYSNPDNNLIHEASKKGIILKGISFEDFIERTKNINHVHLQEQYKFIYDDNLNLLVDFLGRFETLKNDFKKLCQILNIDLHLPHKNKSNRLDYRAYYNDKTMKIIANRYKTDINLFNYKF